MLKVWKVKIYRGNGAVLVLGSVKIVIRRLAKPGFLRFYANNTRILKDSASEDSVSLSIVVEPEVVYGWPLRRREETRVRSHPTHRRFEHESSPFWENLLSPNPRLRPAIPKQRRIPGKYREFHCVFCAVLKRRLLPFTSGWTR